MTTKTKTETAETVETPATETDAPDQSGAAVGSTGVRARRAFTLKQFLPGQDWIMQNVVAKGKGTKGLVGRIYGVCTGYQDKINDINGIPTPSIALTGTFEAESYLDGELSQFVTVFLPMAYAEQLKTAFIADPELKSAQIDLDVGLEATGKTIPYEWVVIAHIEGAQLNVLKSMRGSRARPTNLLAAPAKQAMLPAS